MGLSLDPSTGEICGTPTAYGTSNFTVQVVDSYTPADSDTQALSIDVAPTDLVITTASLPNGAIGAPYSRTVSATGGATPYNWSVIAGMLPTGLSLDLSTGVISGTPTALGTWNFQIRVQDSWVPQDEDLKLFSMDIVTDNEGPDVTNLASVPTSVREGVDLSIALAATADDTAHFDSDILQAEYFIGADPGEGNGTPLSAADGAFDSPTEALTGTIDTSSWTRPSVTLHVRACDSASNWSAVADLVVPVVDATAPGAVTDLEALPFAGYAVLPVADVEVSSETPQGPKSNLVDDDRRTSWETLGSVIEQEEYVILDLGQPQPVGAVALCAGRKAYLFPRSFTISVSDDAVDWTPVCAVTGFTKARPFRRFVWEFESVTARYVKVSGPGRESWVDRRYYWHLSQVEVPASVFSSATRLTWTEPADDGYAGAPVDSYDIRCSQSPITEANFDSCTPVVGTFVPVNPGNSAQCTVNLEGMVGRTYIALKAMDAAGNPSLLSNVVTDTAASARFVNVAPFDAAVLTAEAKPRFQFKNGGGLKPQILNVSSAQGFPCRPMQRVDGQVDSTKRFLIKLSLSAWTPSDAHWKRIKDTALSEGVLFWRLEGRIKLDKSRALVYGPVCSMYFDTGSITGLAVTPSHDLGGDDAVWPDASVPPAFSWTDNTVEMKTFRVDVSTDASVPLNDAAKTITMGGSKTTTATYTPTADQWRRVRALATKGDGTLYWRVRALDYQRALECGSSVITLKVDPGAWDVSALDLSLATPDVSWTHTGDGIVKYSLQVSADASFPPAASKTLKVPAASIAGASYTLTEAQKANVLSLAARNGVAQLHYRVRGEDAQKAFLAYSYAQTADVP